MAAPTGDAVRLDHIELLSKPERERYINVMVRDLAKPVPPYRPGVLTDPAIALATLVKESAELSRTIAPIRHLWLAS